MTQKFDVVVAGSGCSGLSAALNCTLAGKKTLLIEQHNLPGGSASSFRRGRFEIEPSLHELCDYGPDSDKGEVHQLMDKYGIEVNWCECPDCFRVVSTYSDGGHMDVTMPHGIDAFIKKMEHYVPGTTDKMHQLFELFEEVLEGIAYISQSAGQADSNVLKEKFPNLLRTGAYPTKKVFDALQLPSRCQDILSTYWAYLGVDMERLGFIHYAAMVHKYVSRGAYIPAHTSHEISNAFIKRFREAGGEVWYNCRAEEFIFDGDKLCGVKTSLGEVKCDYCLPNINPDIVYGKMVPKELVPNRQKQLANARGGNYGGRMMTAYFCLDVPYEELGIKDYCIFMMGTANSAVEYENIMKGGDANKYCIFLCYNVANKDASPDGTCIISFTSFASPAEWNEIDEENYFQKKEELAKRWIEMLKKRCGIDISGHIEEMAVASPCTFSRYLMTPEGSVYGQETQNWDGMMPRMMNLSKDYPLKGLRPIGAAGPRGDGYSACYITGNLLSNIALKELAAWDAAGKKGGE